jgi:hypothetical protein
MKSTIERSSALIFALILALGCFAHSQVTPFMALGNAQFFDNNGEILTSGVLYSYQAGTSTQQATYSDYTGLVLNPNPIPFGSGARVAIWLTSTATYKFVLCLQNDGASCAPADVLFSVDQVPACPGCTGSGSTFTGTFISSTANPATTGILRVASGDSLCWRNQSGTTNLCISKDTNDVLSWAGGTIKLPEVVCSFTASGYDYLCPDSSLHRITLSNNNLAKAAVPTVPVAGASTHLVSFTSTGYDLQDSGGTAPATTAVTFSATPAFTGISQDQLFTMTLTGNVTSSTLTMPGLPTPSLISFELTQDATGGRTFVWPTNVLGAPVVNAAVGVVTLEQFVWDGTNARLVGPPGCSSITKTAGYALLATDCIVQASVAGGGFTLQIPHLVTGVVWEITRTDATGANVLTITADSGNVNGAASFRLGVNSTTICHADGTAAWCSIPGTEYLQSTTLNGSATTFTYPVPYSSTPNCFCTGQGGSCNVASVSTTACTINLTAAVNGVMVTGKP